MSRILWGLTCRLVVLVCAVACGPALRPLDACPAGRTVLDGVCVSEAVADYVACVRAQGAQLDALTRRQLSAEAGSLGVKASVASEVSESLQRKYSASDAAMMAIIERCGRTSGSSPAGRTAAASVPGPWRLDAMFDSSMNPSVPWSIGHRRAITGALVLFPVREEAEGNPVWWDPRHQKLGTPSLWRRAVGEPRWGIQVGQVAMHPGCVHDDFVVARFSAPVDGRYSLAVHVGPGDVGSVELAVVNDARILRREQEVRGSWAHETGPLDLRTGGTLEFVVGVGPDQCFNDNVPVDLVIHQLAP